MPLINQTYKQVAKKAIVTPNAEETLYTVPAATAVIGQIVAANTSTINNLLFSVGVISGGGASSAADWLQWDVTLVPGEIWAFSGVTLNATDKVVVRSNFTSTTVGTGVIFQIYGELQI